MQLSLLAASLLAQSAPLADQVDASRANGITYAFFALGGITLGILAAKLFHAWKKYRDPTNHVYGPDFLTTLKPGSIFYLCRMGNHGEFFRLWIQNSTPDDECNGQVFLIRGPRDHELMTSLQSGVYMAYRTKNESGEARSELKRYKDQSTRPHAPVGTWTRTPRPQSQPLAQTA